MKLNRILLSLLVGAAAAFLGGCISQQSATATPDNALAGAKTFYVVHLPPDQRRVDRLIADRLNAMGKKATSGEESAMPADVDAVVTYQDKWMWDITMYMIQLDIQVRHPGTDMVMASGHSMRTSLVRKSPTKMVEIVLDEIFKKK